MNSKYVEIITIGDELLIGQVVDTNSAWLAQRLNEIGFSVKQITSISDSKEHIKEALTQAQSRADIIIITGGLGPTKDDITKETLCEYFSMNMVEDKDTLESINRMFKQRGYTVTPLNRAQATVPDRCTIIPNNFGTACGLWFDEIDRIFIALPGVPFEMKGIVSQEIIPRLQKQFPLHKIIHRTVLITGIGESFLAETIKEWEESLDPTIQLAYLPSPGRMRLRLSLYNENYSAKIDKAIDELKQIIPQYIYGYDDQSFEQIVGDLLVKNNHTLATAESCTGGAIASAITSVPGSSRYFVGSIIAYANEVKEKMLSVSSETLLQKGAVSKDTVEQMALGVQKLYATDFAIATSGIAGPDGGTKEKPVGTVWIAVASPKGVISQKYLMGEERHITIEKTVVQALNMLREAIVPFYTASQ